MNEIVKTNHLEEVNLASEESEVQSVVHSASEFLRDEVPVLLRLAGAGSIRVEIGQEWATNIATGNFTIDPNFFAEKGYSPDHCVFATLHELLAHSVDVVKDPVFAQQQIRFNRSAPDATEQQARAIFGSIMTDILGNKKICQLMGSKMKEVQVDIYETRLSPTERDGEPVDYHQYPKHLQFLYKIIRQEMIPGSETTVDETVDTAIDRLRQQKFTDKHGQELDLIQFLTAPNKDLPSTKRFDYWLATIWPEYKELFEADKAEFNEKQQSGQNSGEQSDQDSDASGSDQPQESQTSGDQSQNSNSDNPFQNDYADYFENKHPEPFSHDEHEKIEDYTNKAADESRKKERTPEQIEAERQRKANNEYYRQTGHSLREKSDYDAEVNKWHRQIEEMREVFRSILSEVVAKRRGLSRASYEDGDVLDPNRLAQTITDVKSGIVPQAYQRYELIRGRTELIGKTDYIFVCDCSGSMQGEKSQAAATSALIMLEALAGMERDVRKLEEDLGVDLSEFDIKTALYTFGDESTCLKPLGNKITDKQRLDTHSEILATNGGGTADFLALEDIAALPRDRERQRIVIVVSDGESNNKNRAASAVKSLRQQGCQVFGIAIGSTAAEELYAPNSRLITDPSQLPEVLQKFIESTIK